MVDAYLLTLGSLLLVGGSLGDMFGRRRIFCLGVGGFGLASLLCAAAPDAPALIGARALQGVTAALLVPSNLALIIDTFSERQRAAAIGVWTAWTGIATVAGPLLGGLLVEVGSWRWIFVVNAPLVLVTLWIARHIPARSPAERAHVDWVGGLLCAFGLAGPIFALIEQPSYGWGDPRVLFSLVAGCVLLLIFVFWERRCSAPMLPFGIFRSRNFRVGNLATFALYGSLNVATFFVVVFLEQVGGYRPIAAGLSLLPISIVMFLLAKRFGALAGRFGPRLFMGTGPLVAGAGLLLLSGIGLNPQYLTDVLPGVMLLALGLAITVAPLTATVLSSAPIEHAGLASGINNAVARLAGLIAIAAVGAVVAAHFSSEVNQRLTVPRPAPAYSSAMARAAEAPLQTTVPDGFSDRQQPQVRATLEHASVDSYRLAMVLAAALAFISGILSLIGIQRADPSREGVSAQAQARTAQT